MSQKKHRVCFVHLGKMHDDFPVIVQKLKDRFIEPVPLYLNDLNHFDFDSVDLISIRHCRGYHRVPGFFEKLFALKCSLERIQQHFISVMNPLRNLEGVSDKSVYLTALEENGIELVPTLWSAKDQKMSLEQIIHRVQWNDFVIKPTVSSKSWNTYRVKKLGSGVLKISSAKETLSRKNFVTMTDSFFANHDLCIQKFMPEILVSGELSFVFLDGRFSHAVSKTVAQQGWIAHESFGGRNESVDIPARDKRWAESVYEVLVSLYGDFSYARIDAIRDQRGQLKLLECELLVPRLFLLESGRMDSYIKMIETRIRYIKNQ